MTPDAWAFAHPDEHDRATAYRDGGQWPRHKHRARKRRHRRNR